MLLTYRTEDGRMPLELKRVVERPTTTSITLKVIIVLFISANCFVDHDENLIVVERPTTTSITLKVMRWLGELFCSSRRIVLLIMLKVMR